MEGHNSRLSVLVLENEACIALDMADQIERAGFEVIGPYFKCQDAANSIEQKLPQFAILDVQLEEDTSLAIGRYLKNRGVPFVFVTGCDCKTVPEFPMTPLLLKPFLPAQLRRCMNVKTLTNELHLPGID